MCLPFPVCSGVAFQKNRHQGHSKNKLNRCVVSIWPSAMVLLHVIRGVMVRVCSYIVRPQRMGRPAGHTHSPACPNARLPLIWGRMVFVLNSSYQVTRRHVEKEAKTQALDHDRLRQTRQRLMLAVGSIQSI